MTSPSGKIRVFHLIRSLGRGGAEVLLAEGLRVADRDAFEFRYGQLASEPGELAPELRLQGAEVVDFGATGRLSILLSARRVARELRAWKADIVHCHLPLAGVVGRVAGRLAGVPVVYTEHNEMDWYHPLTRRLNVLTYSWQDRVIAISHGVARTVRRHVLAPVPIDVVLNGVDVDRFSPNPEAGAVVRADLNIPTDAAVVGTVAGLGPQKALDSWLDAAAMIHGKSPDCYFLLVGDGPERSKLELHATSLGLWERIRFVGARPDVVPYLAALNVYMMSSIFEGLGVSVIEAMAMHLPVVGTRVGGVPELVNPGVTGALVNPGDVDGLAKATLELLASSDQRERFGAEGRRVVEEAFDIRKMGRQLQDLYVETLASRRRSSSLLHA